MDKKTMKGFYLNRDFVESAERRMAEDKDNDSFAIYNVLSILWGEWEAGLYAIGENGKMHYTMSVYDKNGALVGEAKSSSPFGVWECKGEKILIKEAA